MAEKAERSPSGRFPHGKKYNLPYLMGVYLAVNAIRDLWLVVDGPDCAHFKGQYIHGKHDLESTLFRADGRHRIVFTGVNAQEVAKDGEAGIVRALERAAGVEKAAAVMLTSMPLCGITGTQYDRIIAGHPLGKPVVEVPGWSLRGDWIDGYAQALLALAEGLEDSGVSPDQDAVAIVGHMMDRNEGDQTGNVAELGRMIEALDLRLVSVWLSGAGYGELSDVGRAGTIVALPYGEEAAALLAKRTGARLVRAGLPMGLEGTRRWIEAVGKSCGREEKAMRFVEQELDRVIPLVEPTVPFYFLNRGVHLMCDPHVTVGLASLCSDLGMRLRSAIVTGREQHMPQEARELLSGAQVLFEPMAGDPYVLLEGSGATRDDLVICNGEHVSGIRPRMPAMELGFPSFTHHALADAPFLGFEGTLRLVERMANALGEAQDLPCFDALARTRVRG